MNSPATRRDITTNTISQPSRSATPQSRSVESRTAWGLGTSGPIRVKVLPVDNGSPSLSTVCGNGAVIPPPHADARGVRISALPSDEASSIDPAVAGRRHLLPMFRPTEPSTKTTMHRSRTKSPASLDQSDRQSRGDRMDSRCSRRLAERGPICRRSLRSLNHASALRASAC